jgi:hypothetical protein
MVGVRIELATILKCLFFSGKNLHTLCEAVRKARFRGQTISPCGLKATVRNLDMSEGTLRREGGLKVLLKNASESRAS